MALPKSLPAPSAQRNVFIKAIAKAHLKLFGSPGKMVLTHCLTSLVFSFSPSRCLHTPIPVKPQQLCHPSHTAALLLGPTKSHSERLQCPRGTALSLGWRGRRLSTFSSYLLAHGTAAPSAHWANQIFIGHLPSPWRARPGSLRSEGTLGLSRLVLSAFSRAGLQRSRLLSASKEQKALLTEM